MGRKPLPTDYNMTDLRLAVGYALFDHWGKAAEFANMSYSNIKFHKQKNGEFINEVVAVVQECLRLRRREAPEIPVDKQIEAMARLYGKAIAVAEEALEAGDYATARLVLEDVQNRNHGKPTQRLQVDATSKTVIELPPEVSETFALLGQSLKNSQRLYAAPPMLEATVLPDEAADPDK